MKPINKNKNAVTQMPSKIIVCKCLVAIINKWQLETVRLMIFLYSVKVARLYLRKQRNYFVVRKFPIEVMTLPLFKIAVEMCLKIVTFYPFW